jgi:hypothetical protein
MPLFKDLTDEASKVIARGNLLPKPERPSNPSSSMILIKVCSAYSMTREEMLGAQALHNRNEHDFQIFCGAERYGYDAVRMLIFIAC